MNEEEEEGEEKMEAEEEVEDEEQEECINDKIPSRRIQWKRYQLLESK